MSSHLSKQRVCVCAWRTKSTTHSFSFCRRRWITIQHTTMITGTEITPAAVPIIQRLRTSWGHKTPAVLWGRSALAILFPTASGGAIQDVSPSCAPLVSLQHLSLRWPAFGTCLPLRDPSKTAQYLSPLGKNRICWPGGLLRTPTALPKSRDDR